MGEFEFLDSVAIADCAVEVTGHDLDDLFETAARALAELMVDPPTVPRVSERTVTLSAPALDMLLYDWLSELIYAKDAERVIFPRTRVRVREGSPCCLTAELEGGPIEAGRTALRSDPKAVTLHGLVVERTPARGWRARVIVDI